MLKTASEIADRVLVKLANAMPGDAVMQDPANWVHNYQTGLDVVTDPTTGQRFEIHPGPPPGGDPLNEAQRQALVEQYAQGKLAEGSPSSQRDPDFYDEASYEKFINTPGRDPNADMIYRDRGTGIGFRFSKPHLERWMREQGIVPPAPGPQMGQRMYGPPPGQERQGLARSNYSGKGPTPRAEHAPQPQDNARPPQQRPLGQGGVIYPGEGR